MATAPLPSPQCGEHVEPGGDQPRRQIAASSSSSSSFSHIETLTNTRPGARATGGASPPAREPILQSVGASLPAAWWCRVSRYRRREGGEGGGGRSPVCVSLSFRLSLSEQNADRKCSCRNDSLHRRQTLTTTPSSPLHFRRRRRHLGSRPRPRRAAPRRSAPGAGRGRQRGGGGSPPRPSPLQGGRGCRLLLSILRSGLFAAARAGRLSPVSIFLEADRSGVRMRWWSCAWVARRRDPARRPRSLPQPVVISFREPSPGRPSRGRPRFDGDGAFFKWYPCSLVDGCIVHLLSFGEAGL